MKRRVFPLSGSASVALTVSGCGGGGGEETAALASPGASASSGELLDAMGRPKSTPAPAPAPATAPAPAPAPTSAPAPAPVSGVAYPFGARLVPYAAGIRPSQSNGAMD